MKLFGKTVVLPKNLKPAPHNDSSKECLFNGKFSFSYTQTNKADLQQQTSGFYPFSMERKDEIFSEKPLISDRNWSCEVINLFDGPRESHARYCSDSLPETYESRAVDSQCLSEGEDQQQGGKVEVGNIEPMFSHPQKEGAKLDVLSSHEIQQNQSVHLWMNNFFRYRSGLATPMAGHGLTDGVPANPLTYWQFMQASAVNYAAYTTAMAAAAAAAAAAAGWSGSTAGLEESIETLRPNVNEGQVLSPLGNDLNRTALPSAATSWWPFRGFLPPGYGPPMGAVHQREQVDTAANAHPSQYGKEDTALEHISSQGEHAMDLGTTDEAETSDFDEDGKRKHTKSSSSTKSGCTLGTWCVREASLSESALQDSESQHDTDATAMPAKCSTQESDTERRVPIESPKSLFSSSDEFDRQVKKEREGSSSGSNTPISTCQASECEAPNMLVGKKRDSYSLFEDNDDICSDAFKKSHQLCGITTMESPKARAKHSEKGRKHQQKDSRHGDGDNPKRLKSCAHELELRKKEVSEEGRKAFRALFTSKLLPQTFVAGNIIEGRNTDFRNEHVSSLTVSSKESDSIYVPVPMEKASGECINPDGSSQGDAIEEVHIHGKLSIRTTCANVEVGLGCGVTKEQHEGNNKSFTISSSSGFLPYKRPLCMEAKVPEQLSSF